MKWAFIALLLLCDVASKIFAIDMIPTLSSGSYPFGGIAIFSFQGITFSLNTIVNSGAAWGLFQGYAGILFFLRVLIILALIIFVEKRLGLWLVLVGAVGNVIDYCLYGHVIDFLHFTFWGYSFPIFNLADAYISIGVLSLLLLSFPNKKIAT
jgi:signal peptidase II